MLTALRKDNKGASVVTYALVLPLFILLIFGIMELGKVVSVRQSLSLGVYKAMRNLSVNGRQWLPTSAAQWETYATIQAREIVQRELLENKLLPAASTLGVQVAIEPEARGPYMEATGWFFTVYAQLTAPGLIRLPMLDTGSLTFTDRQVSYIEGLTGDWIPPRESVP